MKNFRILSLVALFLGLVISVQAGDITPLSQNQSPNVQQLITTAAPTATQSTTVAELSPMQKMALRKFEKQAQKSQNGAQVETIILVIIALFIPFLAVYLKSGLGTDFWIDLILSLLFWLPGVIYALYVILVK